VLDVLGAVVEVGMLELAAAVLPSGTRTPLVPPPPPLLLLQPASAAMRRRGRERVDFCMVFLFLFGTRPSARRPLTGARASRGPITRISLTHDSTIVSFRVR
jgi:hypothetical protein